MKNFSTAARFFALASVFTPVAAFAATPADNVSVQRRCEFLPNAPDQHRVVRGDTLWDISGKFLEHPWCWPRVWGLNREQIRDPHWIYPGQIVYFDRKGRRLHLGTSTGDARNGDIPTVRLSPRIRAQEMGGEAIPAIPTNVIEPFLSQPLIVEEDDLKGAPRIMATQEGRVNLGKGDKAYVRGDLKGDTMFQTFRPGAPLKDPETGKIIGYESVYLGTLQLQRPAKAENEAHSFTVTATKEEMGIGDRLLPMPPRSIMNYVPHPPDKAVDARIVSVYGGVTQAGQNQVVAVNRGKNDGLDIGTVLELYRHGVLVADRTDNKNMVKLPDEQYGTLFIFRVFNRISYGLVMQVANAVQIGDVAKSPE
ncbi:MAG TPA: LysM peptidoglycan-binding domain-containing protein [Burkholderiaceae bacterium]|nr:LysM peptidoglycan-binding domain-containing protein [Burkholderiaceae bacterium]